MNVMAAIYGRVSTDRQSELSIEAQIEACERYCEQQGWTVYDHYADFGISGTSALKRPALQRLIEDAEQKCFQIVVAHKVDRAFRNVRDYENVKHHLEEHDVVMAFVESGINDGVQGEFLNSMMALMAQQYSQNLSREVRKTMRKNVEQGNFLGGVCPIGFKIVNKKYEIDYETAPMVKEIFAMYASGKYSMRQLADHLNLSGYQTRRGKTFNVSSIHGILRNEKYRGVYVHNQNQYNKYGKRKGKKSVNPQDVIRIDNMLPRIIDESTWRRVALKMDQNKKKVGKTRAKRVYLLTGKIFCEECGSAMCGQPSRNTRGYETVYYACSGRKKHNGCKNKSIRQDWIEPQVVEAVKKMCEKFDCQEMANVANQRIKEIMSEQNQEIRRWEKILAGLKTQASNLTDSLAKMGYSRTVEERLLQVEREIAEAEDWLERITPRTVPEYHAKIVKKALDAVIEQMSGDDTELQKKAIQSVVDEIIVSKENVLIKIKAELGESGLSRPQKVGDSMAEGGGVDTSKGFL